MSMVSQLLQRGARALDSDSDSPRLDAELLLGKILGLSRPGLIARGNETVASEHEKGYLSLIEQRLAGMPIAYLTGTREFWSLALRVTPDVLVPRPESELLVELALQPAHPRIVHAPFSIWAPAAAPSLSLSPPKGRARGSPASISHRRRSGSPSRTRAILALHASIGAWDPGSQPYPASDST
jgi:release factor glutamine methyltransferase